MIESMREREKVKEKERNSLITQETFQKQKVFQFAYEWQTYEVSCHLIQFKAPVSLFYIR